LQVGLSASPPLGPFPLLVRCWKPWVGTWSSEAEPEPTGRPAAPATAGDWQRCGWMAARRLTTYSCSCRRTCCRRGGTGAGQGGEAGEPGREPTYLGRCVVWCGVVECLRAAADSRAGRPLAPRPCSGDRAARARRALCVAARARRCLWCGRRSARARRWARRSRRAWAWACGARTRCLRVRRAVGRAWVGGEGHGGVGRSASSSCRGGWGVAPGKAQGRRGRRRRRRLSCCRARGPAGGHGAEAGGRADTFRPSVSAAQVSPGRAGRRGPAACGMPARVEGVVWLCRAAAACGV
jgi:hypothetical protein